MIKLNDSSILHIMPEHLAERLEVKALASAINTQIKKIILLCENFKLYANIDHLEEKHLDGLAAEMRTQYYDTSLEPEVKRGLIKNSLKWYMKAGTPGAVKELVETVFGEGTVSEWFDYGGKPFHFKISTSASISNTNIEYFKKIIGNVKNTRSQLDIIEANRDMRAEVYTGAVLLSYTVAPDIK